MNKCLGCGAIIQIDNPNKEGYAKSIESKFCERCFRIKHYNEYQTINKTNEDFSLIFEKVENSKDLVLLLVDILDIDSLKNIKFSNDIILVITKKDIWPSGISDRNILNINTDLKIVDKVIVSSVKNYHMDELFNKITKHQKSKNVYVIGFTNAGKSTMINKMIRNYSEKEENLTVSAMPSTTLDFLKVKINEDLTLIDTPGLIEEGNICNYVTGKELKKIIPTKVINPKIYQVKSKQSIIVENIFRINSAKNNLIFMMSNLLKVERIYKENDKLANLKKITLNVMPNSDIVIKGLGFIKVKEKETIDIYIDEKIKVYVRKSLI